MEDLRQPLHTLTSLAELLDLKAANLDASLRTQTVGFHDTVRHIDWLLAEAALYTQPLQPQRRVFNLSELLQTGVGRFARRSRAPLRMEGISESAGVLFGDPLLLDRFLTSVLHIADQLSLPDQPIVVALSHGELHQQPALQLDIESSTSHIHAADFAGLDGGETRAPLQGFTLALANCRRILEAHTSAVEFVDLPGGRLRLRVFFPVLSPQQTALLTPA